MTAVKTCLMKYVGFEGRARRSEYWWQLLALIPLIGWLVLIYWAVRPSDGDNDHGPAPAV